ncbi:hypothetical protein BKA70DRAFT_1280967 [Coprinopsis sp. MPI-PUGE-AT-0042]|nr:hypothetical protein BKA70DRAFT_1280967 [Coprinopsis sp. MPI-PUGE-AT-0042]
MLAVLAYATGLVAAGVLTEALVVTEAGIGVVVAVEEHQTAVEMAHQQAEEEVTVSYLLLLHARQTRRYPPLSAKAASEPSEPASSTAAKEEQEEAKAKAKAKASSTHHSTVVGVQLTTVLEPAVQARE